MIQKKVCMVGCFAVGKTSLVSRFANGVFSEKYLTTLGVKIDRKQLQLDGRDVTLILWDLAGEDEFMRVRASYLRGSAAYILVIDGTRKSTLEGAIELQQRISREVGDIPFIIVLNKSDMSAEWDLDANDLKQMTSRGWDAVTASARTGEGVQQAFELVARRALGKDSEANATRGARD